MTDKEFKHAITTYEDAYFQFSAKASMISDFIFNFAYRCSNSASSSASISYSMLKACAAASRVKSSAVGPKPPVNKIKSFFLTAVTSDDITVTPRFSILPKLRVKIVRKSKNRWRF